MNRYMLTFRKKGNLRFISHLDMQRLFRRALYRAEIPLVFSQGFNPHSITNIVMPLSLGFEAEKDYFEFETIKPIMQLEALDRLNEAMPLGICFTSINEIPVEKKNLSAVCQYSEYKVLIPAETGGRLISDFMAQSSIIVLKRDKKTKTMVEMDMKNRIFSISEPLVFDNMSLITMILRTAGNETLNPLGLCESIIKFGEIDCLKEDIRISRTELYALKGKNIISLDNYYKH